MSIFRLITFAIVAVALYAQAPVTAVAFVLDEKASIFAGLATKPDIAQPQLLVWATAPSATATGRYEITVKTSAGESVFTAISQASPAWTAIQMPLAKGETVAAVEVGIVTVTKSAAQIVK